MAAPTLLDIAKLNARDAVVGLIEDVLYANPELRVGAARTIPGLNYHTLVRTGLPTVSFRNANEGVAISKSAFENRLVETYILNPQWECDKAVADRHVDGPEAYLAIEASGTMLGAVQKLGTSFFYGLNATFGDAKGFPGLLDMYDATNMYVDAGGGAGGGASTRTSVWLVRFGPQLITWVWGNEGQLAMADPVEVRVTDGLGNPYTAYRQELLAYPGLQVGTAKAIVRLKNVDDTNAGCGVTDAWLALCLEKFPTGIDPDAIFMTRRSVRQLQSSRTATNAIGAPAPRPTEYEGIPIYQTTGLVNTETAI